MSKWKFSIFVDPYKNEKMKKINKKDIRSGDDISTL